jgi:hypothetical protein
VASTGLLPAGDPTCSRQSVGSLTAVRHKTTFASSLTKRTSRVLTRPSNKLPLGNNRAKHETKCSCSSLFIAPHPFVFIGPVQEIHCFHETARNMTLNQFKTEQPFSYHSPSGPPYQISQYFSFQSNFLTLKK